jgi:hypothetical protein
MLDLLTGFLLTEKATVISLAVTYWAGDIVEGYIFLHDGDSAVIRYLKGFRSDIEAGIVEFLIHIFVTFGVGLYFDEFIYPIVDAFFAANGQLLIVFSALFLFLSSIYEQRTNSHPLAIYVPRIIGFLLLISALYYSGLNIWEPANIGPTSNSSVNMTANKSM